VAVGGLDAGSRSTVRKSLNSCKHLHTLLNEVESSTPHDESKENYQKCTPVKFVIILKLAGIQRFSHCATASCIKTTNCHDITEITYKVALKTNTGHMFMHLTNNTSTYKHINSIIPFSLISVIVPF
jgi:hypothetical protein